LEKNKLETIKRPKYIFNKNGRFLEKAFFSFAKGDDAQKAIDIFNDINYNQVMLEATVAEPASTYGKNRR